MTNESRRRARAAAGLWLLVLPAVTAAAPPEPPPAAAFVSGADVSAIALSPDGRHLAMERGTPNGPKIVIFEPGQSQARRIIGVAAGDTVRSLWWADANTLIADVTTPVRVAGNGMLLGGSLVQGDPSQATRIYTIFRSMAIDLDSAPRILPDDKILRSYALAIGVRASKPGTVVVQTHDYSRVAGSTNFNTRLRDERRESGYVNTLLEVDATTGKGEVVERGTTYTGEWLLDRDGVAAARSEVKAEDEQYAVLARDGRSWKSVLSLQGREYAALAGLTPDGQSVVVLAENGGPYQKLWKMRRDGSAAPELLAELPGRDVQSALTDPNDPTVLGYREAGLTPVFHWFDKARASQHHALELAFPGSQVQVLDRSSDGTRVLARTGSPSKPASYQFVDFKQGRADLVGEEYPALAGAALAEVRAMTYLSRDGASIPAYLLIPPGMKAENLPLVVLPHGGPESRDDFDFDWLAQFIATRGYAVLQPQFRGSTGFGRAHRLAGYREWGGRMQDDVSDGVRHLVATGVANPAKVCIVGASYGGYAALAGAAFTPDLYACVVSINGVADLPQMIGDLARHDGEQSDAIAYWKSHIGPATDPLVAARSPARSAATVRAPILLLHGEFDTVVPRTQSDTMVEALRAAGKPVEFHALAGEDHWLSGGATRLEVLERLGAFLASHLDPG